MKYISLIILGYIVMACSQKTELREGVITQEAYLDTVPVRVLEYNTEYKILDPRMHDMGWPELSKHDSVGEIYTVAVKKISYQYKTRYIYTIGSYADTLTCYKDSVVFSDAEYKFLETKMIAYKGKKIKVAKYQYNRLNKYGAITVDSGHISNRFVSDSLGLIFERGVGVPSGGTVFVEYNRKYNELQKAILRDTLFNKFVFVRN